MPKITRRRLAGAVLMPASALAQTKPPAATGDELETVRENNRRAAEALAKVKIPMETEPAFYFKA